LHVVTVSKKNFVDVNRPTNVLMWPTTNS